MSSSLDHKCQRCGSQFHGQVCPFCTITGLDVNALLASEGLTMPPSMPPDSQVDLNSAVMVVDVVSNRAFPLAMPVCKFGRDVTNDIVLTGDKSLSRFHFQINSLDGDFYVEDAGSRNGTFLNGSPVTAATKLVHGDIVSAGMSRYRLVLQNEAPAVEGNGHSHLDDHGPSDSMPDIPPAAPPMTPSMDPLMRLFHEGESLLNQNVEPQSMGVPDPVEAAAPVADVPPMPMQAEEMALEEDMAPPAAPPDLSMGTPSNGHDLAAFVEASAPTETVEPVKPEPVAELAPEPVVTPPALPGTYPQWCTDFSFSELDDMRKRISDLEEELREKRSELDDVSSRLASVDSLKNRLLATRDVELVEACRQVFSQLEWETQINGSSSNELVLSAGGSAAAIAKIVCTESQPKPNELANLVSSLSTYWSENGIEPKGLLVISFLADCAPQDRPSVTQDFADYAAKKNVGIITSLQLLAIYREVALAEGDAESIKSKILSASGHLAGFNIKAT